MGNTGLNESNFNRFTAIVKVLLLVEPEASMYWQSDHKISSGLFGPQLTSTRTEHPDKFRLLAKQPIEDYHEKYQH